jgi:hypothetical protein
VKTTPYVALLVAVCLTAPNALAGDPIDRAELGRSVKLTILVDKVMQPEEGWVTKEWMIKETAEAGFNVYSPRLGHDRLDEVRLVTEWCAKYGIFHMPWMRGTLSAPDGPEANGKRVVWASGNEQALWSVNSDEFWEWTTRYIVEYAKMSAENPHIFGVFLDYENYAPRSQGNLYYFCYDDQIMSLFAKAQGIDLPELALDARKPWLDEKGLHDAFETFQVNHWRERCRALRKAVDAHDPTFQFCIYPAPGTPFMVQATFPEWGTDAAPIILADASTYGRPSRFLPQKESLQANKLLLQSHMEVPRDLGTKFIYSGGIDPVVKGADPEFSGKNAVMISEVTDGYWIFYEGPTYTKQDHADYWKWFSWANAAIAEGRFEVQHEPRVDGEDWWTFDAFDKTISDGSFGPAGTIGTVVECPKVTLRRDNLLFLAVKAGQPVEVVLKDVPVARYESALAWELRTPGMVKVATGSIPHDETGSVQFTPEKDGLYLLGASSGTCAYSVVSTNVPLALFAGEGLSLIYGAERLYFQVPGDAREFTLKARGAGAETVRLNVYDPEGNQAATGQTARNRRDVAVKVQVGGHAGKTWALEVAKADEGTLEDSSITLDAPLPPLLALTPEHVFKSE